MAVAGAGPGAAGTADAPFLPAVVEEQPPVLNIFVPTRESFSSTPQRTSKLICQASDFSPKQISMAWFRDGKRVVSGVSTGPVETLQSSPVTYRLHSMLTVTESEWLSQSVFTCQVEHKGLNYEKNASSLCTSSECSPSGRAAGRREPHTHQLLPEPWLPGVAKGGEGLCRAAGGHCQLGPSTPSPRQGPGSEGPRSRRPCSWGKPYLAPSGR